jgi:hypothetical protein
MWRDGQPYWTSPLPPAGSPLSSRNQTLPSEDSCRRW